MYCAKNAKKPPTKNAITLAHHTIQLIRRVFVQARAFMGSVGQGAFLDRHCM